MKEIYEKAGLFYLGKQVDRASFEPSDTLTLIKNKNFTTHAAIIGMTGSGKTGLGVALIEEAAIDNIPTLIIDPKGDMTNLCLVDSTFSPERFEAWVADEARAKGQEPYAYAQNIASTWKKGIESWGQDSERVKRFEAVDKTIYTPGSTAGVPINILGSLKAPTKQILEEPEDFGNYLQSTATALLSLIGIEVSGYDSKEYVFIAKILSQSWLSGEDLGIETLIAKIIDPGIKKIGVLPLESFFPQEKRFALASKFNALLASPNFSLWLQGRTLDIDTMLFDQNGNAKVAIVSIAHLSDKERMFFVTLLLNRLIAWMRRQSGTQALRALLYMDEIFGFFPPTKNPPAKTPMLLLLKQARAYGLGVVLSTQNPVDLDYKGLSNIGTWFIGRLQTSQDIDRVIEGLSAKVNDTKEKQEIRTILASMAKRQFFIKSAHLDSAEIFQTRWVLSYLKGPLQKNQIQALTSEKKRALAANEHNGLQASPSKKQNAEMIVQQIDASIVQRFEPPFHDTAHYFPAVAANVVLRYFQARRQIDEKIELSLLLDIDQGESIDWSQSYEEQIAIEGFLKQKPANAFCEQVPSALAQDKNLRVTQRKLKEYLYREKTLTLLRCDKLKLESYPHEGETAFMARLKGELDALKEQHIDKLKERFEKKQKRLMERMQRAQERLEKEQDDATGSLIETGLALLGAFFGRTTATKIGRVASKGTKVLKERGDLSRAKQRIEEVERQLVDLETEFEEQIEDISQRFDMENYPVKTIEIHPKKTDIEIKTCFILWRQ